MGLRHSSGRPRLRSPGFRVGAIRKDPSLDAAPRTMVGPGPMKSSTEGPVEIERSGRVQISRRWFILLGTVIFLVAAHLTRPAPEPPLPPNLPAAPRPELDRAYEEATDISEAIRKSISQPLREPERRALDALERVLRRRPDLVESFAVSTGLNLRGVLDWSVAENDSDTTLLLPNRTSLRRIRTFIGP